MTPIAQEVAEKRQKIKLFFGLIIILTLAFAIKKIFFKPSSLDVKQENLSIELEKNYPKMVDHNTILDCSQSKTFI